MSEFGKLLNYIIGVERIYGSWGDRGTFVIYHFEGGGVAEILSLSYGEINESADRCMENIKAALDMFESFELLQ